MTEGIVLYVRVSLATQAALKRVENPARFMERAIVEKLGLGESALVAHEHGSVAVVEKPTPAPKAPLSRGSFPEHNRLEAIWKCPTPRCRFETDWAPSWGRHLPPCRRHHEMYGSPLPRRRQKRGKPRA